MVFVERYYKIHRIFLMILGLWPSYKSKHLKRIHIIFIFFLYCSSVVVQLATFLTAECNMECIVIKLSYILPSIVYILNYNCFFFNIECIRQSFEHIQLDWETLEDNNEMEILKKYTYVAYVFTIILSISFIAGICAFALFECTPIILDVIAPKEKSLPRRISIPIEFFVDQEEHFFLYLISEVLGVFFGIWSTIATGAFLAAIGQHCCGTYKIASNLIRDTVTNHTLQIPVSQRIRFMYQNIRRAVRIHIRTMQFLNGLLFSFHLWYFPLIVIGVISLSCTLFRLFNATLRLNDSNEVFISYTMFIGHLIYMFLTNYFGQLIIDHSTEILRETYNTLWYVAPLPIQKLFLIMQKSIKDYKLMVGSFYVASLEGFTTLKEVLDHLSYDWEFIRSEEEFIIMDDHASTAKIFTHIFLFLSSIGISVMIMSHIPIPIPTIIDVLLPLNLTRTQGLHLIVEYFVDPSKYFTLILIHLTISICLGVITITSTSLMLLGIGFHCCALFKLANYRMEIIMDQNILRIPSPEKEQIIYKRMIRAIDIHCRAFELCEYLVMNMQKWFLVIIVVGVTSLSINLLRIQFAMVYSTFECTKITYISITERYQNILPITQRSIRCFVSRFYIAFNDVNIVLHSTLFYSMKTAYETRILVN
ncbi:uncharacterized protein LOC105285744 isoform X2 [Ooceraea biroi]|uniref:uncharacterized protein LOC105285744 isoform X2 n=1 Tax=Ooceraea biroi TaxID=2015173 RepID=UPI000F0753EA|nr:uncharacterized protein LOC105285744 isoform X2 [Ooceraea biroi]